MEFSSLFSHSAVLLFDFIFAHEDTLKGQKEEGLFLMSLPFLTLCHNTKGQSNNYSCGSQIPNHGLATG